LRGIAKGEKRVLRAQIEKIGLTMTRAMIKMPSRARFRGLIMFRVYLNL